MRTFNHSSKKENEDLLQHREKNIAALELDSIVLRYFLAVKQKADKTFPAWI